MSDQFNDDPRAWRLAAARNPGLVMTFGAAPVHAFTVESEAVITRLSLGGEDIRFDPGYRVVPGRTYALSQTSKPALWIVEQVESAEGEWRWLSEAPR